PATARLVVLVVAAPARHGAGLDLRLHAPLVVGDEADLRADLEGEAGQRPLQLVRQIGALEEFADLARHRADDDLFGLVDLAEQVVRRVLRQLHLVDHALDGAARLVNRAAARLDALAEDVDAALDGAEAGLDPLLDGLAEGLAQHALELAPLPPPALVLELGIASRPRAVPLVLELLDGRRCRGAGLFLLLVFVVVFVRVGGQARRGY